MRPLSGRPCADAPIKVTPSLYAAIMPNGTFVVAGGCKCVFLKTEVLLQPSMRCLATEHSTLFSDSHLGTHCRNIRPCRCTSRVLRGGNPFGNGICSFLLCWCSAGCRRTASARTRLCLCRIFLSVQTIERWFMCHLQGGLSVYFFQWSTYFDHSGWAIASERPLGVDALLTTAAIS